MELVSILIPNYNYAHFIRKTLDSAVNQTYKNIEIVVVDDGSTDNSVSIIKEYEEKYENIKLYQNEQNLGPVGSHNRAIELSKGEYIVVLSSDDYLAPEFVEECIEKFRKYPSAGMVVSALYYVDDKGNVTTPANYYGHSFICKGIYQCKVFFMSTTFVPSQVLFKRKCIEDSRVGGAFSNIADMFIDTELWFRICLYYDFVYYDKRLCFYRYYIGSYSKNYDNLKGAMQHYLLRLHFVRLARNNEYLMQYADEAIRRTPLYCIRTIKNLIMIGEYKSALKFLRLAEAIDLNINKTDYYSIVEQIIEKEQIQDIESFRKVESNYLDSLKSEESKKVSNTPPYALPDNARLIE